VHRKNGATDPVPVRALKFHILASLIAAYACPVQGATIAKFALYIHDFRVEARICGRCHDPEPFDLGNTIFTYDSSVMKWNDSKCTIGTLGHDHRLKMRLYNTGRS